MLSFYNIWTIAKFEIKTLTRSWFLRIFSGLGVALIFLFNLIVFTEITDGNLPRFLYGMSSSIPYSNLLYFNVVQAIITIFLASDFLKRDKKLDTTEAIYIRSMTNSDYVLGKTVGILTIFIVLNIVIIILSLAFDVLAKSTSINFSSYLFYPLVISLPTLIFIVGFSFLVMTIIRNQAVTFILLLGYVSLTLFYLGGKYYNIFDYTGFFTPLLYSDFIGFSNELELILQRGTYLLIGLSFIFLTMFLFRRLPQSLVMKRLSLILSICMFAAGVITASMYVTKKLDGENLRSEMIELNKKYSEHPNVTITDNHIELEHNGYMINCTSYLKVMNETDANIDKILLCLNPGLNVTKIISDEVDLDFKIEKHTILITPKEILNSGDEIKLNVEYGGTVLDDACYLDINENKRNELKRIAMYTSNKIYSIISPTYVLLTSENLWYPHSGVTFNPEAQFEQNNSFTNYSLSVNSDTSLTAISQGDRKIGEEGQVNFTPENPLPKMSLILGNYVQRSIEVGSITYNLYTKADHNYFDEYLNEIGDTLSALIREVKQDYEREINLEYSYKRFSIVETPIQFTNYNRLWTVSFESTQPEMSLLPENGIELNDADFKSSLARQKRFGNRSNQVILPRENQSNLMKRFINTNILDGPNSSGFRGRRNIRKNFINPYTAFPNYYSYVNSVSSMELPLLNAVLELYLKIESDANSVPFVRSVMGLTNPERAIQKFSGLNLKNIISDTTNSKYIKEYLKLKGKYLFTAIGSKVGESNFKNLIKEVLDENRFKNISFEILNEKMISDYEIDMMPFINQWFSGEELPGYFLSNLATRKIIDDQRERYQLEFNITNPEEVDGFLKISFAPRSGPEGVRGRRFRRGSEEEELIDERIIYLGANQTKKIGAVLDEAPGKLTVNTLISQNLPLQLDITLEDFEENKKATPFDGEKVIGNIESFTIIDEIVIDNIDSGFVVSNPETTSWLKRNLNFNNEEEEKYIGIHYWWAPGSWRETIHSDAYGKYVHSAHYTRAENGNIKVEWNAEMKESGYYDVYSHIIKVETRWMRDDKSGEEYHYSIFHDDGQDNVTLEIENAEKGWNLLGSFYFSEGNAKVELSNNSPEGIVIADALKWIKRN